MITRKMVKNGYENGTIQLVKSPNKAPNMGGVVCKIGEYWFYFGGLTAEEYDSVEAYKADIPKRVILNDIYNTLKDFLHDSDLIDEYRYYEYYLKESERGRNEN